jgi:7-cyano-7-deazaguanine synthase in queuosine biosynthesis
MKLPISGLETLERTTVQHAKPGVVHSPEPAKPAKASAPLQPNAGLIPLLISAATYTAIRCGASSIISGFSHIAPADHLGLAADQSRDPLRESLYALRVAAEALSTKNRPLAIEAPLLDIAYPQIIKLAKRLDVPLEYTWSCTAAGPEPCGRCPQCRFREASFTEALELDPVFTGESA